MKKRKLRPALEIVSNIGSLGFDLQHHSEHDIAQAIALLRTVNPRMFDWLVETLRGVDGGACGLPETDHTGKSKESNDVCASSRPEGPQQGTK